MRSFAGGDASVFQAWLKKHAWLGTILAAIGLAGIFAVSQPDASE
jgi:hypothetical protein